MPFESWDEDQNKTPLKKILIAIALVLLIAVPVGAVYKITSAPSDPLPVTETATLTKPTYNATTAIVGDKVLITSTLSDHTAGVQVFFYENSNQIGNAYTDSNGVANYLHTLTSVGNKIFVTDCIHQ